MNTNVFEGKHYKILGKIEVQEDNEYIYLLVDEQELSRDDSTHIKV